MFLEHFLRCARDEREWVPDVRQVLSHRITGPALNQAVFRSHLAATPRAPRVHTDSAGILPCFMVESCLRSCQELWGTAMTSVAAVQNILCPKSHLSRYVPARISTRPSGPGGPIRRGSVATLPRLPLSPGRLGPPQKQVLPPMTFLTWLQETGKYGGTVTLSPMKRELDELRPQLHPPGLGTVT